MGLDPRMADAARGLTLALGVALSVAGCIRPTIIEVKPGDKYYTGATVAEEALPSDVPAPYTPGALACKTDPLGQSAGNHCALTPAVPADPEGRQVAYVDGGSTCPNVSVDGATGSVTFTAPAKSTTCVILVKASNGSAFSSPVSSETITGQNNAPARPSSLFCPLTPPAGSTGNACTLTAATPVDPDNDTVTYVDDSSTCAATNVNASTGAVTFTAPAKGVSCVVKIRASDGQSFSSGTSSATITAQNNVPNTPSSLSCDTTPLGGSTGNTCTLTAASPVDSDNDSVTYSNDGSTCGDVTVTAASGAVSFTAPAKGATCEIKVRAHDGSAYSGTVTSATITGRNNAPSTPAALVCPSTPAPGSAGNTCTLTAASPADLDGDAVTYADDGSTCAAPSVSSDGATITFTAPADGESCAMKVKAHDGTAYSTTVSSATITATSAIMIDCSVAGSQTFNYTGDPVNIQPGANCSSFTVKAWGGAGGGGWVDWQDDCLVESGHDVVPGAGGGYATGNITVTPGEIITIQVGQGGRVGALATWPNGGKGIAFGGSGPCNVNGSSDQYWNGVTGAGGGSSSVSRGSTVLLEAGGGAGGSWSTSTTGGGGSATCDPSGIRPGVDALDGIDGYDGGGGGGYCGGARDKGGSSYFPVGGSQLAGSAAGAAGNGATTPCSNACGKGVAESNGQNGLIEISWP